MRTSRPAISSAPGGAESTSTKRSSAWQATRRRPWPVPVPLPARADIRPRVTSSSSRSPGTTWRRNRARSMPPNSGQLAGEAGIGQDGHAAQLGQRLDHQHPGKGRPAGEVTGEERLVAGQLPTAGGRLTGLDGSQLGHEEERIAVRQVVFGSHDCRGYRSGGPGGLLAGARPSCQAVTPQPPEVPARPVRRPASRDTSTNGRASPLVSTWRAFLGGGPASPAEGRGRACRRRRRGRRGR